MGMNSQNLARMSGSVNTQDPGSLPGMTEDCTTPGYTTSYPSSFEEGSWRFKFPSLFREGQGWWGYRKTWSG